MKKFLLALLMIGAVQVSANQQLNDTDYINWGIGTGPTQIQGSTRNQYLRCQINGIDTWGATTTGLGIFTDSPAVALDVRGAASFGAAGTQSSFNAAGSLTLASGASISGVGIATGVVTTAALTGNGNSTSSLGVITSSVATYSGSYGLLAANVLGVGAGVTVSTQATFTSSVTINTGGTVLTLGPAVNSRFIKVAGGGTGYSFMDMSNTSNQSYLGIEGSGTGNFFTGDTAYSLNLGNGSNTALHLATNGAIRETILGGGAVGFGTITPASPAGGSPLVASSGTIGSFQVTGGGGRSWLWAGVAGGHEFVDDSFPAVRMFMDNTGNTTFGGNVINTPLVFFPVVSSSGTNGGFQVTATGGKTFAFGATTTGAGIYQDTSGGAARLFVNNAGNVGIGTTGPATLLHMSSGTLTIDGTGAAMNVAGSTFVVLNTGFVGVGTNAPGFPFTVNTTNNGAYVAKITQGSTAANRGSALQLNCTNGSTTGTDSCLQVNIGAFGGLSVQQNGVVVAGNGISVATATVSSVGVTPTGTSISISSVNATTTFAIQGNGVIISSSASPTVSCNAGTGVMSADSTNTFGSFTAGSAAANCTVTFSGSGWPNNTRCVAVDDTSLIAIRVSAQSKTAFTVAGTTISSDVIQYICLGN